MLKPRILFVDDEQDILEGLKMALRKQRGEWDMDFALSGPEALVILEQKPVDVVISDMRMPGMDGAEFLAKVMERWPSCARLVLSGQAERESVMKAMSVAHQFLSKPLQADILKIVVSRAIKMQHLLHRPELLDLVGRIGDLPSLPGTYTELIRVTQDPNCTVQKIASVVEQDPLVSAKVLQLVNSAFFGLSQEIGSVNNAVRLLGPQMLMGMALSASMIEKVSTRIRMPNFLGTLQKRALRCCYWTRRLMPDGKFKDEAVTAALIHDLGTVLLALADPWSYESIQERALKNPLAEHELEDSLFGVTHAEVGAYLFGLWGLPLVIVEAIACHHNPEMIGESDPTLLATLQGSDVLAACENTKIDPMSLADLKMLEQVDLLPAFQMLSEELKSGKSQ